MSPLILLATLLLGGVCNDVPVASIDAGETVVAPMLAAIEAADPAILPSCPAAGDAEPLRRWPATGRFWLPLRVERGPGAPRDSVLTVRALGGRNICLHWPVAAGTTETCRSPRDRLGLTLQFPVPPTLDPERIAWITIDGTLFKEPTVQLGSALALERDERQAELWYGFYFGLLFAMAAIAMLGFVAQRQRTYAWYAAFAFTFALTVAGFTGHGTSLLSALPGAWTVSGPTAGIVLCLLLLIAFVRAYLDPELGQRDSWRSLSGVLLALCAAGLALVAFVGESMLPPVAAFAALTMVSILAHLTRRTIEGSERGRILLAALGVLAGGVVFGAAHVLLVAYEGVSLAYTMILAGALVMPLVLTAAVYQRFRRAVQERDQVRGELVATQRLALLRVLYCRVTGLPRRQKLAELFDQLLEARSSEPDFHIGLYLVQIDNLSDIRQHYGREALDHVMVELAGRLRDGLSTGQTVGRLDDWDLALLIPLKLPERRLQARVRAAAESMMRCTEEPVAWHGESIALSASVGVALSPEHGLAFGDLLRRCDAALFDAQAEGGNRIRAYSEQRYLQRADRWTMLQELEAALTTGELELHYQPIHSSRSGRLLGVEALVRWPQPDGTVLLPGDFIPLAEESDLIVDLGWWVASTAVEDLAWLEANGLGAIFLSLNVSPRQLAGEVFATQLTGLLERSDIAPRRVHVEITETRLVEGLERTRRLLRRMDRSGLRIFVDDFGVGYSSLSYLRELPIHGLKIDRSFIENIGRTAQDETVLGSVLHLAHGLGLEIIAEGVETVRQREFLVERGCHALQGHLYAEPLRRDDLLAYAKADLAGIHPLPHVGGSEVDRAVSSG